MALECNISVTIGKVRFKSVHSLRVSSRSGDLADLCAVSLPLLQFDRPYGIESSIAIDDEVKVEAWYSGRPAAVEFSGWVRRINPNMPLVIEAENTPPQLRQAGGMFARKWSSKVSLRTVIDAVLEGTGIEASFDQAPEFSFEKFRCNGTRANILMAMGREYGLFLRYQGGKIVVGIRFMKIAGEVTYNLATNVHETALRYKKERERVLAVNAVGFTKNGAKFSATVGDKNGEVRTKFYYNIAGEADLKALATAELKKLSYDGYEGSITGWLLPRCSVGQTVKLLDPIYLDRAAAYYLENTELSYSVTTGFERRVDLGLLLSSIPNPGRL